MRFAVATFPGSNCDVDCVNAVEDILGVSVSSVWHHQSKLDDYDALILPGGFSYGDYLRTGALARFSPVMESVAEAAAQGKLIIGICNGFQILCEAGLLPGALMKNDHLQYRCSIEELTVENNHTAFTLDYEAGESIRIPIAHGEGNYYCDPQTLQELNEHNQIIFRYRGSSPNGSIDGIAGIINRQGNVLGMMPHPERAIFDWMGSADGAKLFTSMLRYWEER